MAQNQNQEDAIGGPLRQPNAQDRAGLVRKFWGTSGPLETEKELARLEAAGVDVRELRKEIDQLRQRPDVKARPMTGDETKALNDYRSQLGLNRPFNIPMPDFDWGDPFRSLRYTYYKWRFKENFNWSGETKDGTNRSGETTASYFGKSIKITFLPNFDSSNTADYVRANPGSNAHGYDPSQTLAGVNPLVLGTLLDTAFKNNAVEIQINSITRPPGAAMHTSGDAIDIGRIQFMVDGKIVDQNLYYPTKAHDAYTKFSWDLVQTSKLQTVKEGDFLDSFRMLYDVPKDITYKQFNSNPNVGQDTTVLEHKNHLHWSIR